MNRLLIVSYSYSGNTHRIAQGDLPHDWRRLARDLSLAALSHGVPGTASRKSGGRCRRAIIPVCCPAPAIRSLIRSSLSVPPTGAGRSRLRWRHGWRKTTCPQGHPAVLLPLRRVPCDPGRDIAGLCPRADVRKALGRNRRRGASCRRPFRTWIGQKRSPFPIYRERGSEHKNDQGQGGISCVSMRRTLRQGKHVRPWQCQHRLRPVFHRQFLPESPDGGGQNARCFWQTSPLSRAAATTGTSTTPEASGGQLLICTPARAGIRRKAKKPSA